MTEKNNLNGVIESDAPAEQIKELIEFAPSLSPVFRAITGAVPVSVKLMD